MNRHVISVLVENEFGVLTRVAGLFSGRGYNIESLSVAPTLDPTLSRMTIVTSGSPNVIEQIIKQLNRLVNVIKVQNVTAENPVSRMLALIKVALGRSSRAKLASLLKGESARVVHEDERYSIVEAVSEEEGLASLLERLKPHGVMEYAATGTIAIQKGKKMI